MNSLEELFLLFIEQNGSAVFGMCFCHALWRYIYIYIYKMEHGILLGHCFKNTLLCLWTTW